MAEENKADPTKASYWVGKSFRLENPLEFVETVLEWRTYIEGDDDEEAQYDAFLRTVMKANLQQGGVSLTIDSIDLDNEDDVHDCYFTLSCEGDEIHSISLHDKSYSMDFGHNQYSRLHKEIWERIVQYWYDNDEVGKVLTERIHKPIPHRSSPEEIQEEWNRDEDYINATKEPFPETKQKGYPGPSPDREEYRPPVKEYKPSHSKIIKAIFYNLKDYNKLEQLGILTKAILKLNNDENE